MAAVLTVAWAGPTEVTSAFPGLPNAGCRPWRLVRAPDLANDVLSGIAGTSTDDVWATGYNTVLPPPPIILHWDGATWTQSSQPVSSGHLYSLAAISATDAWAVGDSGPVLTEHWDGTAWRQVRTPSPGSYHYLYGVSAVSSTDIWAVGDYEGEDGGTDPLALHWDGTAWSQAFAPSSAPGANVFEAVSSVSSTDVWAVGYQEFMGGELQPLIELWDGAEWVAVPAAPPPYGNDNVLYGVSAISLTDVWAVGEFGMFEGPRHPLLEHWDGTAWSFVQSPTLEGENQLYAVAAASGNDVWAVGRHDPNQSFNRPLTMHWDGLDWSVVGAPSEGLYADMKAVGVISSTDVWAAGAYFDPDGHFQPLLEHSRGCAKVRGRSG